MPEHVCIWITVGVAVRNGEICGEEQRCYGCDSYMTRLGIDARTP
jgi:hypothetical protein